MFQSLAVSKWIPGDSGWRVREKGGGLEKYRWSDVILRHKQGGECYTTWDVVLSVAMNTGRCGGERESENLMSRISQHRIWASDETRRGRAATGVDVSDCVFSESWAAVPSGQSVTTTTEWCVNKRDMVGWVKNVDPSSWDCEYYPIAISVRFLFIEKENLNWLSLGHNFLLS